MTTQPVPDLAAAAALAPVMDEISAGKLAAADLERIAAERMRATFAVVAGAIWAENAWGRYWGWDPKETWALITILVYTFVVHMRLIPAFKTPFSFNFASLIAIGSVLMTYFGVNYYLSGLHSYAGGDSAPVPTWLFIVVGLILSFSFFAWYNNRLVDGYQNSVEKEN